MIETYCYTVKFGSCYAIIEALNENEAYDIACVELGRRNGPFTVTKTHSCELANLIIDGGRVFSRGRNFKIKL